MGAIDEKMVQGVEKAADRLLKHSERWTIGQKIVAFLVCLLAGLALVTGVDRLRVAAGLTVMLFGVAFLTFRRRTIETEALILKDSQGKPRIALSADHGVVFYDKGARARLFVDIVDGQPMMLMTDDKERVIVGVTDNGATLTLGRADGSGPSTQLSPQTLSVGEVEGLGLTITSDADRASVGFSSGTSTKLSLSATDDGAILVVGNAEQGSVRLVSNADGKVGILLFDNHGHSPAKLAILGGGTQLAFFRADGHRIATYPDEVQPALRPTSQ